MATPPAAHHPSKPKTRKPRAPRGLAQPYWEPDRGTWCAAAELPPDPINGRRRRKKLRGPTARAAVQARTEWLREQEAATVRPQATMTTEAWLEYWYAEIAARRLRPKTLANYRSVIDRHIVPALGRTRVSALTAHDVRTLHKVILGKTTKSGKPVGESTALLAHAVLGKALADARREEVLADGLTATERVDRPDVLDSQRRALEVDEAIHILATLDRTDPLATRWAMSILAGARQGEVIGLERERVHTTHVDITWQLQHLATDHGCSPTPIPRGVQAPCGTRSAAYCPQATLRHSNPRLEYRHLGGALFLTAPKTKSGRRLVPIVEPLTSLLHMHIETTDPGEHGLVWTKPDGAPLDPRGDLRAWHTLLAGAGIPPTPLHSARSVAASALAAGEVATIVRTDVMGWSTIRSGKPYERAPRAAKVDAMGLIVDALRAHDTLSHLAAVPAPDVDDESAA